jgi:hypothetical protein
MDYTGLVSYLTLNWNIFLYWLNYTTWIVVMCLRGIYDNNASPKQF